MSAVMCLHVLFPGTGLTVCSFRRQDCLRRLVYVLYEQHSFEELCQLPFVGLEDEVRVIM